MKTQTFTVISSFDLEELIQEHSVAAGLGAGEMFSVEADLECGNDTWHVFRSKPGEILRSEFTERTVAWYIAKLQVFGAIPMEHAVLVEVSW